MNTIEELINEALDKLLKSNGYADDKTILLDSIDSAYEIGKVERASILNYNKGILDGIKAEQDRIIGVIDAEIAKHDNEETLIIRNTLIHIKNFLSAPAPEKERCADCKLARFCDMPVGHEGKGSCKHKINLTYSSLACTLFEKIIVQGEPEQYPVQEEKQQIQGNIGKLS